jgi:trehalose 6-phosphate phosphatase
MRYLFSQDGGRALEELAQERTLCAFDFDGTLAPIAQRPEEAKMRATTRRLLRETSRLYPCVVISGRARRDVVAKLDGVGVDRVFGNHGAESERTTAGGRKARRWKNALTRALHGMEGVWIEDKYLSLAVHYREAEDRAAAGRLIREAVSELEGVRWFGGKMVVNVVEEEALDKGDALVAERKRTGCDWAIYVGDDQNDEDAFGAENVVAVRVGRKPGSRAGYYLRSQKEIDELLVRLIAERKTDREPD